MRRGQVVCHKEGAVHAAAAYGTLYPAFLYLPAAAQKSHVFLEIHLKNSYFKWATAKGQSAISKNLRNPTHNRRRNRQSPSGRVATLFVFLCVLFMDYIVFALWINGP